MVEWVEPQIYILAHTTVLPGAMTMLENMGAEEWAKKHGKIMGWGAEPLIEIAGRTCYKSFGVGLNPNVTKIREDSADYFKNVLSKGDGSIFEHATVTFGFVNVSRIFTHELVRHRVGTAISQESMRYSRPTHLKMVRVPGSELDRLLSENQFDKQQVVHALETAWEIYERYSKNIIVPEMAFDGKKAWTSALRRMLPDGIATSMVWTANHRTLRHVIEMRTHPAAEAEIRYVFDLVATRLRVDFPLIYGDFERMPCEDGVGGTWKPTLRSKV